MGRVRPPQAILAKIREERKRVRALPPPDGSKTRARARAHTPWPPRILFRGRTQKEQLADRRSAASQQRMRSIAVLADADEGGNGRPSKRRKPQAGASQTRSQGRCLTRRG